MAPQTQIDPGYSGKLVILLYNLTNRRVKLAPGDHLATVEFRDMVAPANKPYSKPGIEHLSQYISEPLNSSLFELRQQVDTWSNRLLSWVPPLIASLAVLVTIIGIYVGFLSSRLASMDAANRQAATRANAAIESPTPGVTPTVVPPTQAFATSATVVPPPSPMRTPR